MIQGASRRPWWQSSKVVTYDANGNPTFSNAPQDNQGDNENEDGSQASRPTSTNQYSVMEANFSLFFGLSIQLYLGTLVADDTPFDRFLDGQPTALTPQQQAGLNPFCGKAGCARCHSGSELTEASFSNSDDERIDHLTNLNGVTAKYDEGFLNTGVRTVGNDLGVGGTDPFGYPLA